MLPELTDIHIHLLPGLDDGVHTMEEALAVLRTAAEQKITRMIVTPHFHPEKYPVTAEKVLETLEAVRVQCRRAQLQVELYAGQECYFYSELADKLEKGHVLTMAGSRYVLIEFEPYCSYSVLLSGIKQLLYQGYLPILAHFERYECLLDTDRIWQLKELGVRMQMNFDRIREKNSIFHKNIWRSAAKQGLVDYFGSDCHGMDFRPLQVDSAYKWLEQNLSSEDRQRIFERNIEDILKNR